MVVDGEEDVGGVDEDFVGAGVEDGAESGLLVVVSGDVAVDVVGNGHEGEEDVGGVTDPLVFGSVGDDEGDEHRDEEEPGYGYFVGEVH